MKHILIVLILLSVNSVSYGKLSGTYKCTGEGRFQPNISSQEHSKAQIGLKIDFGNDLLISLDIKALKDFNRANIKLNYDERLDDYIRSRMDDYDVNIRIEPVIKDDPSKVSMYIGLQYEHYSAGFVSYSFDYVTEPLSCTEMH